MTTCPKGHASTATDYCDECGTPINAVPTPASATPPPSTSDNGTAQVAGASGPCPECGTARTERFCEVCGHDFLAEPGPDAAAIAHAAASGPAASAASAPAASGPTPAASAPAASDPAASDPAAPDAAAPARPGSPTKTEWRVVVTADQAYYERMRAAADPDAAAVAFPVYCPERRFVLTGTEVLIGRMSRSRGIEPGIDLTGPPEDAAVSHMHALLVVTPAGGWTIVDLDSANGTYLNDHTEQLAANQPVALSDGDQVHVGGWTTLTVRAG
ncbi:MAG: hypothetical protein QOE61_5304 [Micromonosporaceae bacterium]|nr:hypothetical protein [Micromonosporaceae bacterium]